MTYEESKEYILQNYFDGDEDVTASSGDEEIEAMKCVVGALDKQIPKKPKVIAELLLPYCSNCNHIVTNKYCSECGQRVDWSEKEKWISQK